MVSISWLDAVKSIERLSIVISSPPSVLGSTCAHTPTRVHAYNANRQTQPRVCFLNMLACVYMRPKAWRAARMSLQLARLSRPARAAATVLYAHAFVPSHTEKTCGISGKAKTTVSCFTAGCLSFHPMAQCVVHALKGLACRASPSRTR